MAPLVWSAVGLVIKTQLSGLKVCRGEELRKDLVHIEKVCMHVCESADSVVLPHKAAQVLVKRCVSYLRKSHTSAHISFNPAPLVCALYHR